MGMNSMASVLTYMNYNLFDKYLLSVYTCQSLLLDGLVFEIIRDEI